MLRIILFLFCILLSFSTFAQTPPVSEEKIRESVTVELVDLYLTATDKRGRFITDLKAEELFVREDDAPQSILQFGPFAGEKNEVPLLLTMVIDNSASMDEEIEEAKKLDLARDSALMWLEELGPLDRAMIVSFHETATFSPLTGDRTVLTQALQQMRPHWRYTALFDTLNSALEELNRHSGRKLLFLCSDGQDNLSKAKLEDVLTLVSKSPEVTVIVLGTVATDVKRGLYKAVQKEPPKRFRAGLENLQTLANKTAGYAFFPTSRKEVLEVRDLIRSFIRTQYSLVYRSTNTVRDGNWRDIRIQCKRKDVTIHYRQGYYAN